MGRLLSTGLLVVLDAAMLRTWERHKHTQIAVWREAAMGGASLAVVPALARLAQPFAVGPGDLVVSIDDLTNINVVRIDYDGGVVF